MTGGVCLRDALDPGFGDAHDADLGHLHGVCFYIEDAQVGDLARFDLREDWEKGGCGETEMVFDIFIVGSGALAQVGEPEGFDDAVFGDENAIAALAGEIGIDGDGVKIEGAVARGRGIGGDGNGCDVSDNGFSHNDAQILVEAKEDGGGTLSDGLSGECGGFDRSEYERGIVLDNGVVGEGMKENHFAFDDYGICNGDGKVAEIVRDDCTGYDDETLFCVDDKAEADFTGAREAVNLQRHDT